MTRKPTMPKPEDRKVVNIDPNIPANVLDGYEVVWSDFISTENSNYLVKRPDKKD